MMMTTDDIVAITDNVISTMLNGNSHLAEEGMIGKSKNPITGCVQITGQWNGAVLVQATNEFANHAAASMLALDAETVSLEDRQDTVAELTNMIGGNIKSLVPGPSYLSLPSITTGNDFDIRVFGATVEHAVPMEVDGQLLRVVVCRGAN